MKIFDGEKNTFISTLDFYYEGGSISGTQNLMILHFVSGGSIDTAMGFNASIKYKIIDQECKNWLEISSANRSGKLVSPYYPDFYNKSASCSWILFVPQNNIDSIIMTFVALNVRILIIFVLIIVEFVSKKGFLWEGSNKSMIWMTH